jgi:glucans biosynthesis protein
MHGGAAGSGAPKGNKNRLTHGFFTAEAVAERAWLRSLVKELKEQCNTMEVF